MSEWRRDPSAPGADPSGYGWLIERLRQLEQQVADLSRPSSLNNATMSGLLRVLGDIEVDAEGKVQSSDFASGATGWRLAPGVAEFNDLLLRGGIIGNDALANPVAFETIQGGVNNYQITTTSTVRHTVNLTVPAGFTQAIVLSFASAMGYNNTAVDDYLYVQAVVNGVLGGELYTGAASMRGVGLSVPFNRVVTGLTGGSTVPVGVATRASNAAWVASASNQANVYATAIYLR